MPLELKTEVIAGVLQAEVSGPFSLSNAKTVCRQVLKHVHEQDIHKVLIDLRSVHEDIPIIARFDFATFMSDLKPTGIRFAFVDTPDNISPDRFFETALVNRAVNAKVTADIGEALAWLGADSIDTASTGSL